MREPIGDHPGGASESDASLGWALQEFLHTSGLDVLLKHPELHSVWESKVGADMAKHTRVLAFRRGVLEIGVDCSALMNEMQFLQDGLLHDLRRAIRKPFISRLSFVLKPSRQEGGEPRAEEALSQDEG